MVDFKPLTMKYCLFLTALLVSIFLDAFAEKSKYGSGDNAQKTSATNSSLAAGCAPPSGSAIMELNNVRTIVYTGGDMWWDLIGSAKYEVPKNSGKHALFSGSLWMGGIREGDNALKLAAMRFRQKGNDYWPGPLTLDGASVTSDICSEYDKLYRISRAEVDLFVAWWTCSQDPDCDESKIPVPGEVFDKIENWPAHGDLAKNQAWHLAPFYDRDGDNFYDPLGDGDFPYYDLYGEIDCRTQRDPRLFGDETLWWVFNDRGNIHTETNSQSIGMEVRAQAFAFATNDEINDMTFYNYELINRSSFTLNDTYFAQWVDADLGDATDDYVGCDVMRGLGYCYNGDNMDGSGGPGHYGAQPPALGVDFFEGPYQDSNLVANAYGTGPNEALNGLGYGDSIVDNERFGMRRFMYHNNSDDAQGDPETSTEHYNYMRGIWKDGTPMVYGGTGHITNCTSCEPADFMFPGNSDQQYYWGTDNVPVAPWDETTAGNTVGDRRFMQSAGPFTLQPGAVNDITVGVVFARATTGGAFASVDKLRSVDDKAQSLFENCFKVLDGPDAPELGIIEMNQELILTLSNCPTSNNANEDYEEVDPFIADTLDNVYRFQGYQIFQVKDASVSVSDLHNPDLARLVAQTDIKDSVGRLINYYYNDALLGSVPVEEVDGSDEGLRHSFRITQDEFATGDRRLVNHKHYYYIAISYAYNNYDTYIQDVNPGGQKLPYLAGRKDCRGGSISVVSGIPHINLPEQYGTIVNAEYGSGPELTRIEGTGNGGIALDFTEETEQAILNSTDNRVEQPTYLGGAGPVDIKVYNPLNVPDGEFTFRLLDTITAGDLSDAYWSLKNETTGDEVFSQKTISTINEQLIEEWGLSVSALQQLEPSGYVPQGGMIESTMEFSDDNHLWLTGVKDADGTGAFNWIRSGTAFSGTPPNIDGDYPPYNGNNTNHQFYDPNQYYEQILGGTWAPYKVASQENGLAAPGYILHTLSKFEDLASVDIVITPDKDKWSRCPVIEMNDYGIGIGGAQKFNLRQSPAVNKDGQPDNSGRLGMGWFPGYAINLETGERLNLIFGEDSWQLGDNGGDMLWNPTSNQVDDLGNIIFGGKHYIYILGHVGDGVNDCPAYDEGQWAWEKLSNNNYSPSNSQKLAVFNDVMWVNLPLLVKGEQLLSSEVRVRLRISKPYKAELAPSWAVANPINNQLPLYTFNTGDLKTVRYDTEAAQDALALVNIVPNPYLAYSAYEVNQLDNRVKITNLPEECLISIYTLNGALVKKYNKYDPKTSLDWDLKNHAGIPISSGVYIIHIDAGEAGEKVLKFFAAVRELDLDSF